MKYLIGSPARGAPVAIEVAGSEVPDQPQLPRVGVANHWKSKDRGAHDMPRAWLPSRHFPHGLEQLGRQGNELLPNTLSGKGVHRLTAQELGREVGLADGTIFRHFKDKAEIVRAAIAHLEGVLFKSFPPTAEEPLERLREFFVGRLTLVHRMPSVFLAAFSDRLEEAAGDDAGVVRSIIERSQGFVRQCIAEAHERRHIDPALSVEALTLVVVGTLQAAAFAHRRSGGKKKMDPKVAWQTIEIMLKATGKG